MGTQHIVEESLTDSTLPLQRLVVELNKRLEEKDNVIDQQRDAIEHHKHQQQLLEERIRWLINGRYRSKSETDDRQLALFNEAEVLVDQAETSEQDDSASVTVKTHQRRGKRRALPKDAPRIRIEHDLPDEDKLCRCCGEPMGKIGEEKSEQLDIVPEKIVVLEHIRFRYACNHCHDAVLTAPLPVQPLPKSNASAGLLAYLIVMKYVDGLPLHRIEKIFQRLEYHQPRSTLARWMIQVAELSVPLIERLLTHARQQPFMHADETPVQVLKEVNRAPQSHSYMWAIRAGPPHQVVVAPAHPCASRHKYILYKMIYHYDPSRGSQVLEHLLGDYQGYLQCDGWSAYPTYASQHPQVTLVGCFAHAQVKFKECLEAQKKLKADTDITQSRCRKAMHMIRVLYDIEEQCKALDEVKRHAYRQQHSLPALADLRAWVDQTLPKVAKESLLGKAVHYLHNQWDKLIRYTEHGGIPIDNNPIEQAIRKFVIGRNAWLFSDTPSGAKASAALYTLVQTAMLNGVEPYRYLRKILGDLPNIDPSHTEQLDQLLPWNVDKKNLTMPDY